MRSMKDLGKTLQLHNHAPNIASSPVTVNFIINALSHSFFTHAPDDAIRQIKQMEKSRVKIRLALYIGNDIDFNWLV